MMIERRKECGGGDGEENREGGRKRKGKRGRLDQTRRDRLPRTSATTLTTRP